MNVVYLQDRNTTIRTLENLLRAAKSNGLQGFICAAKLNEHDYSVALTGDCETSPEDGLAALGKIHSLILKKIKTS